MVAISAPLAKDGEKYYNTIKYRFIVSHSAKKSPNYTSKVAKNCSAGAFTGQMPFVAAVFGPSHGSVMG